MKTKIKLFSLLAVLLLFAASLSACGSDTSDDPAGTSETVDPLAYLDVSGVDFSAASVSIAADDYDGMRELAKKLQNYELAADTVIEIFGEAGASTLSHTIVIPNAGKTVRLGITYEVPDMDENLYPSDGTPLHIVGAVRINNDGVPVLIVPSDKFEIIHQ